MTNTVLLVAAAVMGMAFSLTWAVWVTVTRTSSNAKFEEALEIIQSSEITEIDGGAVDEAPDDFNWFRWWNTVALKAGRHPKDPATAGRAALLGAGLGAVFGMLVFPGGAAGVVLAPAVLAIMWGWMSYEAGKRRAAMDLQMPILLSALRSQMHAGMTAQAALVNVADDIPSPLGEEVRQVKRDVNVSMTLDQALDALAKRVPSRQMQFLVASIGIAVRSGSDLVPQLVVIEEIVQQRARIDGKIKSAVALAKPTAILAAAAPIVLAGFFVFSDPAYITFFLGEGLLWLLIATGLYVSGLVLIRLFVRGVENT